ncbi:unnamed protein product [Prorocentrum cordatum]|uniref:SLC41A/MgtE integral membrane domain-containing protein n=1 Tax=Prorocentrum cordatum TaxID=2364126 RepID=A0ABN9RAD3_9DINO|nr:unnamed protein product [Polarella glacialis]
MAHEEELTALLEETSSPSHCGTPPSDDERKVRHRSFGSATAAAGRPAARRCGGAGERDHESLVRQLSGDLDSDTESLHKFWHRAGWLILLLMFQSTSSLILERFDLLIRSHPVVIYFLTMLVGAGGNAGSQSTVLVVRQLALATVGKRKGETPDDRFSLRHIVASEVSVGARLALVLFLGTFVRCVLFQVRGEECLAICLSMLAIVFVSTVLGAALPLLLNRLRLDPAHAGAAIQVIMDISGVTLTCVVSCLVLGLPITGGHQVMPGNATGTAAGPHGGSERRAGAGFVVQNEGARQGLSRFGAAAGQS